ncbi:hypothetical protein SESBI_18875 [Sesbania bispinosa]|nr:hypothetical protein SESBI_18875 [Sesbania bispinosa]
MTIGIDLRPAKELLLENEAMLLLSSATDLWSVEVVRPAVNQSGGRKKNCRGSFYWRMKV